MDLPIIMQDGKPVFIGKEDTSTPPVRPVGGNKMECPVCHAQVDYLLGQNEAGGVQGCEGCWKPPTEPVKQTPLEYDKSKEIL